MTAWESLTRYTAASSTACSPTNNSGGAACNFSGRRTCARASGPIFEAQPAQLASDVRRICRPVVMECSLLLSCYVLRYHIAIAVIVARFRSYRQLTGRAYDHVLL